MSALPNSTRDSVISLSITMPPKGHPPALWPPSTWRISPVTIRGVLEVDHRVDDVAHLAHPADREQFAEGLVVLLGMHRSLDDARRDSVDANAAGGVLDRQRLGSGLHAALGQRRQHRRNVGVGVVDQAGGDVDDVAAALSEHVRDGQLGHAEEPGQVHSDRGGELVLRVVGEGLGDEDPGVIDQGVYAAEALDGRVDDAVGGGGIADVALDGQDVGVLRLGDGARGGDGGVAELAVGGYEAGSDALRRTGDDRDLLAAAGGHAVTGVFPATNSRRARLTSSEWVQAMLCGPPSIGTSVQSAISAGSRAAVASNGRMRSSVPCMTSTRDVDLPEVGAEVGQPGADAGVGRERRGTDRNIEARLPGTVADPGAAEDVEVVEVVEEALEERVAILDDRRLDPFEDLTVDALRVVVGLEHERRDRPEQHRLAHTLRAVGAEVADRPRRCPSRSRRARRRVRSRCSISAFRSAAKVS